MKKNKVIYQIICGALAITMICVRFFMPERLLNLVLLSGIIMVGLTIFGLYYGNEEK